jgi:hypothetical protein
MSFCTILQVIYLHFLGFVVDSSYFLPVSLVKDKLSELREKFKIQKKKKKQNPTVVLKQLPVLEDFREFWIRDFLRTFYYQD